MSIYLNNIMSYIPELILLVGILAWWSTKDLKRRPEGKKQIVV